MEVGKVSSSTEYKSTQKGALVGAMTGGAVGAAMYGLTKAITLPVKYNSSIENKKAFIKDLTDTYKSHGVNMSKTTVSKVIKDSQKVLTKPQVILAGLLVATGVGAMFGAIADVTKHHRAKKS